MTCPAERRPGEKDIRTYVQRKREVFLVHMACDNKREEIDGTSATLGLTASPDAPRLNDYNI